MTYYTPSYAMRSGRGATSRSASTNRRNQNTVRFNVQATKLGPISNMITLALILCMLGLMYLTQITKQTSYGYEINALDSQKSALLEDQQSLEVEAARLQALERVQKSKVAQNLVEPATVEFAQ